MLRFVGQHGFPDDYSVCSQRRCPLSAEMNVDAITFDNGSWRRMAVLRVLQRGLFYGEGFDAQYLAARRDIERQNAQRGIALSIRGGCEPHAPAGNRRRG